MFTRNGRGTLDVLRAGVAAITARLRHTEVDPFRDADVPSPRHKVPVGVVFAAAALQLLVRGVERLSDGLVRPVQRHRSRHRVQSLSKFSRRVKPWLHVK